MKKYLALSILSAAFLTTVGCTEAPKTGATPAAAPSVAAKPATPAAAPSAAPSMAPSGAPASAAPQAGTQTMPPSAGLSLDVPGNFEIQRKGDQALAGNREMKVVVVTGHLTADEVTKFKAEPGKQLESGGITDLKVDKATEKTDLINNINTWLIAGTGKMKGEDVDWAVWLYEGPNKEYLMALAFGQLTKNQPIVETIRKSVKPNSAPADVKAPAGKSGEKMGAPEGKGDDAKSEPEAKEKGDKEEGGAKGGDAKEDKEDAKEEGGK